MPCFNLLQAFFILITVDSPAIAFRVIFCNCNKCVTIIRGMSLHVFTSLSFIKFNFVNYMYYLQTNFKALIFLFYSLETLINQDDTDCITRKINSDTNNGYP
ncbi:hypothetical protein CMALT394_30037 [Carnobacterium maltaromaticum]|nr:hypothetical protein CMALT394_30037 [Carnobacterium maltaromaticum]